MTTNTGERDLWAAPLSDVPVPAAVPGRRLALSELALCVLLWLSVAYVVVLAVLFVLIGVTAILSGD